MSHSRMSFSSRKRLNTSIKVAALIAGLAFVAVVLEQPRLVAAPSHPRAATQQVPDQAREGAPADVAAATPAPSMPEPSESLPVFFPAPVASPASPVDAQHPPVYFPGQFVAPGAPIDTQPPPF